MLPCAIWDIDRLSQYHFHTWNEGTILFVEGEGGTYLLNDISVSVLQFLEEHGKQDEEQIVEGLTEHNSSLTRQDLSILIIETLTELYRTGIVVRLKS